MKRFKKELSLLLATALVFSFLNIFDYNINAGDCLPDYPGNGIFRVDVHVAANDCGNASRGTDSNFRLDLLDSGSNVIASSPALPGISEEVEGDTSPLEANQITSYTFDSEDTGADVHVVVPGLAEMSVNKEVSQLRFIEVEHHDDFTHRKIVVYFLVDGVYLEIGKHEYIGNEIQFSAIGHNVVFNVDWFADNVKTIEFDSDEGNYNFVFNAIPGQTVGLPDAPTKPGYDFNGWLPALTPRMPQFNTLHTAQWIQRTYTIVFDANGGFGGGEQPCIPGDVPIPPEVTRDGYIFIGWFPEIQVATDNATYTAWWKTDSQSLVVFDANGGTGGTMTVMDIGSELTPPTVERTGYSFLHWDPEVPLVVPGEDVTFTAQWYNGVYINIVLEVGRKDIETGIFAPLSDEGGALKENDVVTVRITPTSDFLVGATRYVVMFDKEFFEIAGSNKDAFIPNTENPFYAAVAPDYSGTTNIPDSAWPAGFDNTENFNKYKAVAVGNRANSTSANGGFPDLLPGEWLFSFDLKVIKSPEETISGRIWMDERWIRNPDNTTGLSYFSKCLPGQYSSQGDSISYYYETDLSAAVLDIVIGAETSTSMITFELAGGIGNTSIVGVTGEPLPIIEPPLREGYTFIGWTPELPLVFPEDDLIISALWDYAFYVSTVENSTCVIANDWIYGLAPGITKTNFENNYLRIHNDLTVEYSSSIIGTGTRINVVETSENSTRTVLATYTIVIFGDVNGDGLIDGNDVGMILDYENWLVDWDTTIHTAYFLAGDLNGDGNVDSIDSDLIADSENWIMYVDQATGLAVLV